jgi:hypothetical protein
VPPPPDLEEAYAPRRVALLVGLDAYADPALGDLRFAAKDASDLAEVLQSHRAGGFDEVELLLGSADREAFWQAWREVTRRLHRDDTLLLYYAGHGTLELGADGTTLYLLPSDAQLGDAAGTGISLDELAQDMDTIPAHHRVVVVDACYAGRGRSGLSQVTRERLGKLRGPAPAPMARQISRYDAWLHAAHHDQTAMEDPGLENGVYTHFLIRALEGDGDLDGDGLVDVVEAHTWARDHTLDFTGGAQVPWVQATLVGRDAIYLAGDPASRRTAEHALLTGLEGLPDRAVVHVDGLPRGAGRIDAGRHRIELSLEERAIARASVHLQAGERYDLGRLLRGRQARTMLGPGLSWTPPSDTTTSLAWSLGAWWWPADLAGGRPGFGLRTSQGIGPIQGVGTFLVGEVQGSACWAWGDSRVLVGPCLGAGALWRLPDEGAQAGMLLAPSLHTHLTMGDLFLGLDHTLRITRVDDLPRVLPALSLSGGFAH